MYERKFLNRLSTVMLIGLAIGAAPTLAVAKVGAVQTAKVSMSEARTIALKAYPGKIIKQELEHEGGGSGLRYSFDMRHGTQWREVGVDAMTGRVLENAREGANPKD